MALPNLSALQQQPTGRLQNAHAWLGVRRFKREDPNTDPITLKDWRAWVRDPDDGLVPKYGWVLEVNTGDGKRTPEIQYLYDVEELAQHLINGGDSPTSRLPAHRDDRDECIARANELRRARGLSDLEPQGGEQSPPPLPLTVTRDRRRNNAASTDPELMRAHEAAARAASREVQEVVQARRAEERAFERAFLQGRIDDAVQLWDYYPEDHPRRSGGIRAKADGVLEAYVIAMVQLEHRRRTPAPLRDPAIRARERRGAQALVPSLEDHQPLYDEFAAWEQRGWPSGEMLSWAERAYRIARQRPAPPTFPPTAQQRDAILRQLNQR